MTTQPDTSVEESVYDKVQASPFTPYSPDEDDAFIPPETQASDKAPEEFDEAPEPQVEPPAKEPVPEFDERHKEPFTGLLYLGRLQKSVDIMGHQFVIKTLTTEDLAEVAMLVKPYEGSTAKNLVNQTATVAASVVSLDGRPIVQPLGREEPSLRERYDYVAKAWMPPVREKIWAEVFGLETLVREMLDEMGNASG